MPVEVQIQFHVATCHCLFISTNPFNLISSFTHEFCLKRWNFHLKEKSTLFVVCGRRAVARAHLDFEHLAQLVKLGHCAGFHGAGAKRSLSVCFESTPAAADQCASV